MNFRSTLGELGAPLARAMLDGGVPYAELWWRHKLFAMNNLKSPGRELRGVSYDKSRKLWKARIQHGGTTYQLGRYISKTVAGHAYDIAALYFNGPDAKCNFPCPANWPGFTRDGGEVDVRIHRGGSLPIAR